MPNNNTIGQLMADIMYLYMYVHTIQISMHVCIYVFTHARAYDNGQSPDIFQPN